MSLYNLVNGGFHPSAAICLGILKLKPEGIGRFRDAWLSDDGRQITILTRTGGGNRADYLEENERLAAHPLYIRDLDDRFDLTFARFTFAVPPEFHKDTATLASFLAEIGYFKGPGETIKRLQEDAHGKKGKVALDEARAAEAEQAYDNIRRKIASGIDPEPDSSGEAPKPVR